MPNLITALFALLLSLPTFAFADAWVFHRGDPLTDSYAGISSGPNVLQARPYGTNGSVALYLLVDRLESKEALTRAHQAGEPMGLRVWRDGEDYNRAIPLAEYRVSDDPGANETLAFFLMAVEDFFAMADGKAVFVSAGSVEFRFDLTDAAPALRSLIDVVGEIAG